MRWKIVVSIALVNLAFMYVLLFFVCDDSPAGTRVDALSPRPADAEYLEVVGCDGESHCVPLRSGKCALRRQDASTWPRPRSALRAELERSHAIVTDPETCDELIVLGVNSARVRDSTQPPSALRVARLCSMLRVRMLHGAPLIVLGTHEPYTGHVTRLSRIDAFLRELLETSEFDAPRTIVVVQDVDDATWVRSPRRFALELRRFYAARRLDVLESVVISAESNLYPSSLDTYSGPAQYIELARRFYNDTRLPFAFPNLGVVMGTLTVVASWYSALGRLLRAHPELRDFGGTDQGLVTRARVLRPAAFAGAPTPPAAYRAVGWLKYSLNFTERLPVHRLALDYEARLVACTGTCGMKGCPPGNARADSINAALDGASLDYIHNKQSGGHPFLLHFNGNSGHQLINRLDADFRRRLDQDDQRARSFPRYLRIGNVECGIRANSTN